MDDMSCKPQSIFLGVFPGHDPGKFCEVSPKYIDSNAY